LGDYIILSFSGIVNVIIENLVKHMQKYSKTGSNILCLHKRGFACFGKTRDSLASFSNESILNGIT